MFIAVTESDELNLLCCVFAKKTGHCRAIARVRNPMYSGWWMLFAGICLQWHNAWALLTVPVNWGILTAALKATEERWLLELYGQDYADYMKRVNRCIPWLPRSI